MGIQPSPAGGTNRVDGVAAATSPRRLSCGRVDGVEATRLPLNAVAATASRSSSYFSRRVRTRHDLQQVNFGGASALLRIQAKMRSYSTARHLLLPLIRPIAGLVRKGPHALRGSHIRRPREVAHLSTTSATTTATGGTHVIVV